MARDVMILMGQIHFKGPWKGWALKIETFLGPEMAMSEAICIWAPKSRLFFVRIIFQEKTRGVRSYNVYLSSYFNTFTPLKGHGNEADFLGFLQKLVGHESLRLPFEPFRFRLRIRGDIRNRKTTPRLAESGSRQECL